MNHPAEGNAQPKVAQTNERPNGSNAVAKPGRPANNKAAVKPHPNDSKEKKKAPGKKEPNKKEAEPQAQK